MIYTDRYNETNSSIFFTKAGLCFHRSFERRFYNLTIPEARAKLRRSFSHAQQNEIIHYLKEKKIIK